MVERNTLGKAGDTEIDYWLGAASSQRYMVKS